MALDNQTDADEQVEGQLERMETILDSCIEANLGVVGQLDQIQRLLGNWVNVESRLNDFDQKLCKMDVTAIWLKERQDEITRQHKGLLASHEAAMTYFEEMDM